MESVEARRRFPALVALSFFLIMVLLYSTGFFIVYRDILLVLGIRPFIFPFVDTDTVLSAVRCMNHGVDVYVSNPCDALRRVYDYSPLWMVLTVFPMTPSWLPPIGMAVDLVFLASLLLLPAGRTRRDMVLITAGVLSSATIFAVERGNNDLVLFVLAACAASLSLRSAGLRLLGYSLALLAGLLKYYPMALMALAIREKPARLFAIAGASILALAVFMVITWHDLTRALTLIPTGRYFDDMFGSITVGGGLAQLFGWPQGVARAIRAGMSSAAIGMGVTLGARIQGAAPLAALNERERAFFFAGSLMILGCFFTAQNIGYRALHLLLVLPALAVLRQSDMAGRFRPAFWLAFGLLWSEAWRRGLMSLGSVLGRTAHDAARYLAWGVREVMWWWLVVILISGVTSVVMASPVVRLVVRRGSAFSEEKEAKNF